jgi:hypothetical protein
MNKLGLDETFWHFLTCLIFHPIKTVVALRHAKKNQHKIYLVRVVTTYINVPIGVQFGIKCDNCGKVFIDD